MAIGDIKWGLSYVSLSEGINYINQVKTVTVRASAEKHVSDRQETRREAVGRYYDPNTRNWEWIYEYTTVTVPVYEPVNLAGATARVTWTAGTKSGTVGTFTFTAAGEASGTWTIDPLIAHSNLTAMKMDAVMSWTITAPEGGVQGSSTRSFEIHYTEKPKVTAWNITEGNPDILPGMPFIQGYSVIKAAPVVEGRYGATVSDITVTLGNNPLPSGGASASGPGTWTITLRAWDSRDTYRPMGGQPPIIAQTTVTIVEYSPPTLDWKVERANESGEVDQAGLYLKATLQTEVAFLAGANVQQIRLYTRPRGASSWTPRNVINPTTTTHSGTVTIDGGGIYDRSQGWEVKAEVEDAAAITADSQVVPSGGVIIDSDRGHVAIGQYVDPTGPAVQLKGPVKVYGPLTVDGLPKKVAVGKGTTGSNGQATVTLPVGFVNPPAVTVTAEWINFPTSVVLLANVTATSFTVRQVVVGSGSGTAAVPFHWTAIEM